MYVLFGFSDNWILDLDSHIELGLDYVLLNLFCFMIFWAWLIVRLLDKDIDMRDIFVGYIN